MVQVLSLVALGLCGVSTLFTLIGLALPRWWDIQGFHAGLFRFCGEGAGSSCINVMDWPTYKLLLETELRATQAMVVLGFLGLVCTLVLIVLSTFVMKDKKIIAILAGVGALAAGFLLMIGMAIYVDKIHNSNLGAGFAMNILGWLSAWATGGLLLFLAIRGGGEAATT